MFDKNENIRVEDEKNIVVIGKERMEFYSRDPVTGKYVLVMWTDKNNVVSNAINNSIEESEENEMELADRMNRFIENYYKREEDKIIEKYDKKLCELNKELDSVKAMNMFNEIKKDALDDIFEKFKESLNSEYKELLEKDEITILGNITLKAKNYHFTYFPSTEGDKEKLKALHEEKDQKLDELCDKCKNLELLIDTCETMEDFNELLKAYGILNDDGTLI